MAEEITGRKETKKMMLSKERTKCVSKKKKKFSIKCYTYIPHQKFPKCRISLKRKTHACKNPHVESANQKDHFTTYRLV